MSWNLQRIVFPTDFSELSLQALNYARSLSEGYDAELHCLHIVDDAYQYWSALGPESIPVGPPPENMGELANDRMKKFAQQHLAGLRKQPAVAVCTGRPFAEIIRFAREIEADLIVMATHGRGAIAHMLLGSTTEKVVRKAGCAVLTVRSEVAKFEMP